MRKSLFAVILGLSGTVALAADKIPAHPLVLVETTMGSFKLELDSRAAPLTVRHFVSLVESGFYMRGTIAMARTGDPHSANSQFFINVADNNRLDPGNNRWGYAVFGYVIEGMDVVDEIVAVQTGPQGNLQSDVPVVPIVIKKMAHVTYD
jgi:cyclophilin family peptidyl-prolyl cis-trans isomerase